MSASRPVRGRLAPSPTGFLHLGNAWAFLLAWLACRSKGGSLVLRMEDIDPDRSRPEYADAIIRDLRWLGLDWDEGPDAGGPAGPYVQSARMGLYADALNRLDRAGHIYPCYCTRKELRTLAGAPHVGDAGAAYPGTCRNLPPERRAELEAAGRRPCIRLHCPSQNYAFEDAVFGPFSMTLEACGGDFALRRSDGVIAYQLAVVVDDGLMGITQVVRGEDLLVSTPRQLALFDLLGYPRPAYMHLPLLCDPEGERLAKRHASLTLASLRDAGVSPAAVAGYLGWKAGLIGALAPAHPRNLLPAFDPGRLRFLPERVLIEADLTASLSVVCWHENPVVVAPLGVSGCVWRRWMLFFGLLSCRTRLCVSQAPNARKVSFMAVYDVFTPECLNDLFPIQRTNDFFDALFGDAEEGAYDIRLVVDPEESDDGELHFYFELHQRAGRCLVCSLTYGLPQVFERHPIINLKGLVSDIASRAGWELDDVWWRIGTTESLSSALHRIPLVLIQNKGK